MSTVQSLLNNIAPRVDSSTLTDMIPLFNLAIRMVAKRLYYLKSDILREQMSVKIFAEAETWELMTLDVAPATAWAAGDTITGATSGETCYIEAVITTKTFYVSQRSGDFTLSEVMSNGTYTADQGAANPTFSSAMVIVDGGASADTITYVGAQFVNEGFQTDMPVTTSHASNTGTYRLVTVAAGTLTFDTGVLTAATSSDFIITSDDSFGYLPTGFWGLIDDPYIDGKTYPLRPLPSQAVALQYSSPGEPIYYQLRGSRLYVTPNTSADYTIKGDYFLRPTAVSATTSTIPWDELFDDAICECVLRLRKPDSHEKNISSSPTDDLIRAVDLIAAHYGRVAPQGIAQQIDWSIE